VAGIWACLLAALQLALSHGLPPSLVEFLLGAAPSSWHGAVAPLTNGFHPDVNPDDRPTLAFLLVQFLAWISWAALAWRLLRRPASPRVLVTVLIFAALLRAILLPSVPVHDALAGRGLWEGRALAAGVNPYRYEPGSLTAHELGFREPREIDGAVYRGRPWTSEDEPRLAALASLRDAAPDRFAAIPDPHRPTTLGPLLQTAFALVARLFPDSLLAWKALVMVFDLGSLILLLRLLPRLGFPRSGIILYAWSPLVLTAFANAGRPDPIPIFFLLLALSLALPGRPLAAAVSLATAALANVLALAAAPVLFRSTRRPALATLACLGLVVAGLVPFAHWQGAGLPPLLRGANPWDGPAPGAGAPLGGIHALLHLAAATGDWARAGFPGMPGIPAPLGGSDPAPRPGDPVRVVIALAGLALLGWHATRPVPDPRTRFLRLFRVLGALFILSPEPDPARLAWVIPFLCAFPRPSWIVLTLSLQAWFLQFPSDLRSAFGPPPLHLGLVALVWLPFLVFRFLDSRLRPGKSASPLRARA
jgi:hypothetical protein